MKKLLLFFSCFIASSLFSSIDFMAGFFYEKNKVLNHSEIDQYNYRYYQGKSTQYGLFLGLKPTVDLNLFKNFIFSVGPFIGAGTRNYKNLPPTFYITDSYFFKTGLDMKLLFHNNSGINPYLSAGLGFLYEEINWKYQYSSYDQSYKESIYRKFYFGLFGFEIPINPLFLIYFDFGVHYGQFTSNISGNTIVEGSPKKKDWGYLATLGLILRIGK